MAYLQHARAGRPTTVEVLDELGRLLPDSSYPEKLSIEGAQILLRGQSSAASALAGQPEGSKLLGSHELTGTVQPDHRHGRCHFTVTRRLAHNYRPANDPAHPTAGRDTDD